MLETTMPAQSKHKCIYDVHAKQLAIYVIQ